MKDNNKKITNDILPILDRKFIYLYDLNAQGPVYFIEKLKETTKKSRQRILKAFFDDPCLDCSS